MKEIWKPIINYEGLYDISNYGRIKSIYYGKERILKPRINCQDGYCSINLWKNRKTKTYRIHSIVLETFVGPRPPRMECRHLDGNPTNNRLDNLKWGTHQENIIDSVKHGTHFNIDSKGFKNGNAKLNDNKIKKIRKLHSEGVSDKKIAKIFNVSRPTIWFIVNDKTWRHIK